MPPATQTLTYDWAIKPERDLDTTFLFDVDEQALLVPGDTGMFTPVTGAAPWLDTTNFDFVPGKWRTGVRCKTFTAGVIHMPGYGVLDPREFSVEYWWTPDVDWLSSGTNYFCYAGNALEDSFSVMTAAGQGGRVKCFYKHEQDPAGPVSVTLQSPALTAGQRPPGVSVHTLVTFKMDNATTGTFRLYDNGTLVASQAGIVPATHWEWFVVAGGETNRSLTQAVLDSLRVNRRARVPGQAITLTEGTQIVVDPATVTGKTIHRNLTGGVHHVLTQPAADKAVGMVPLTSFDKILSASPIKAGAPDATHPSLGHSGLFSYDWQAADRTLAWVMDTLGHEVHIRFDSCPQILGGSVAPLSGTNLTTGFVTNSTFAAQVPNDFTAFAAMCADLVYHFRIELGRDIRYWSLWNEPDGGAFWLGTMQQYLDLYGVVTPAVKAIEPALKMGGFESVATMANATARTWTQALINYCATNGLPLDWMPFHLYNGKRADIQRQRSMVNRWCALVGFAPPELAVTEWDWMNNAFPGNGVEPWRTQAGTNAVRNDLIATYAGQFLLEMQRRDYVIGAFFRPYVRGVSSYDSVGLVDSFATPMRKRAAGNVFLMFNKLGDKVLASSATNKAPGVDWIVTQRPDGTTVIMASSFHYQKLPILQQRVDIDLGGITGNVTMWLVDEGHSNFWDAGASHEDLETVPPPSISGGTLTLDLKPRATALIEIAAAGPPPPATDFPRLVKMDVGGTPTAVLLN